MGPSVAWWRRILAHYPTYSHLHQCTHRSCRCIHYCPLKPKVYIPIWMACPSYIAGYLNALLTLPYVHPHWDADLVDTVFDMCFLYGPAGMRVSSAFLRFLFPSGGRQHATWQVFGRSDFVTWLLVSRANWAVATSSNNASLLAAGKFQRISRLRWSSRALTVSNQPMIRPSSHKTTPRAPSQLHMHLWNYKCLLWVQCWKTTRRNQVALW